MYQCYTHCILCSTLSVELHGAEGSAMTASRRSPVPQGIPSEEEDDHDLLTYGIAGNRLRQEISAEESTLSIAIEQHGDSSEQAVGCRARLDRLRSALQRQEHARAQRLNDKQFFGEQFDPRPQSPR